MKLVLQIAIGVFLGTLASQLAFDAWQSRQARIANEVSDKLRTEQERIRQELSERIRTLLTHGRQGSAAAPNSPPPGVAPDDARGKPSEEN